MFKNIRASSLKTIVVAIVLTFISYVIVNVLWDLIRPFSYIQFLLFVVLAAWIGGFRSGLLTTIFTTLMIMWKFLDPQESFLVYNPIEFVRIVSYVFIGVVISVLFEKNYRSEEQYHYWNSKRRDSAKADIIKSFEENNDD